MLLPKFYSINLRTHDQMNVLIRPTCTLSLLMINGWMGCRYPRMSGNSLLRMNTYNYQHLINNHDREVKKTKEGRRKRHGVLHLA